MSKFYSCIDSTRGGFFDTADHGEIGSPSCIIPPGAKEVTEEQHAELVAAQSNGKLIVPDPDGYPIAIEPPPPSDEQLVVVERVWRDQRLSETDGVVARHRDEVEGGLETTLTPTQYTELQAYRRALRNWPEAGEFPLIEHRPPALLWLTGTLQ